MMHGQKKSVLWCTVRKSLYYDARSEKVCTMMHGQKNIKLYIKHNYSLDSLQDQKFRQFMKVCIKTT